MRLPCSICIIVACMFFCNLVAADQRMNVIVLVSDDQRYDALGVAGNDVIHTPRLDQLAQEGIHFTQTRVTSSVCMTSRASILTGQYMSRHGIDRFGKPLSQQAFAQTYTGLLRQASYWTGFVGKYGIGTVRQDDFDFVRVYYGRHWYPDGEGGRIHITERNARDSLAFLRQRPKDQPFCLSVSYFAPHAEDQAPEQYLPQDWSAEFYENVTIPIPRLADERYLAKLPAFLSQASNEGRVRYHWRFDTPRRFQQYMINYYRLITEVDEAIGRLIDELKEQGVYENTLIIFIGDNGYFYGERGLADKWYPYEESLRVPLIIHDPRLSQSKRGITREQMVLNIDLAATIVAAAGLPVPDVMQGEDLAPLYLNPAPPAWRDEFFYEHPTITSKDRIPASLAVVRRDVKYVYWPEHDYEQLFDLTQDPDEVSNMVEDPAYMQIVEQMREKLQKWRKKVR